MKRDPAVCEAVLERLEAWLDDELGSQEAAQVAAHVDECAACGRVHRVAMAVTDELRALPVIEPPPELKARLRAIPDTVPPTLMRAATPRREQRRENWRAWRQPIWRAALAASLVVAALGWSWWESKQPQAPPPEVVEARRQAREALQIVSRLTRRAGRGVHSQLTPQHLVEPAVRTLEKSLDTVRTMTEDNDEGESRS